MNADAGIVKMVKRRTSACQHNCRSKWEARKIRDECRRKKIAREEEGK